MLENKEYFGLSNFPKNSKYNTTDNEKVPRKMKNEYGGKVIYEFAAIKPKSCTIIDENNCEKSVHKGHNSNFKSGELKDILFNKKRLRHALKILLNIQWIQVLLLMKILKLTTIWKNFQA